MENNNDFNEMRSQIAQLRRALDDEKIVNTKLLRTVMGTKLRPIMKEYFIEIAIPIIMMPYCGYILTKLTDNSAAFIIVTELFFLAAIIFTWYIHRGISIKAIVNGDLVDTGRKLAKLKRMTVQWQKYAIPFAIPWMGWFLWENMVEREYPWLFAAICLGFAILGMVVGLYCTHKKYHTIDELLSQIDELTQPQKDSVMENNADE